MHVFIDGIHLLMLVDPVERDGTIVAEYEVVHRNRFAQEIGYIRRGQSVPVSAAGRSGYIDLEPISDSITNRLAVSAPGRVNRTICR